MQQTGMQSVTSVKDVLQSNLNCLCSRMIDSTVTIAGLLLQCTFAPGNVNYNHN